MTHPRCGLAAASPSRGASPDTEDPVDLSCLASGRTARFVAACKARQRTGKTGSAASARLGLPVLRSVTAMLVLFMLWPAHAGEERTPKPAIEPAARGERCVADTAVMRRNHMDLLKHQRDDTVRGGIRGAKYSLNECIGCHAGSKTGSVAQAPSDFCVSCHRYAAVSIDCFECHSSKPSAVAMRATP